MKKERIIFADPDQEYLNFLEGMVIPDLEKDAEIVMINEFSYFQKYINELKKEDILFVEKEWGKELAYQKYDHMILVEDIDKTDEYPFVMPRSWDEEMIKEQILVWRRQIQQKGKKDTKTLLIYSPIGGSGVSSAARESAEYLAKQGKKVFFIGADTWQDYRSITDFRMDETAEIFFMTGQKGGFSVWKQWICHLNFDMLPPFKQSYVCLGIKTEFFRKIEKEVRESGNYDWIIVETDHGYNEELSQWMADADKIFFIIRQGQKWKALISAMERSIAIMPREKFCFVYNFFERCDIEEEKSRQIGWDGELFLSRHEKTKEEWREWGKHLGEMLCE